MRHRFDQLDVFTAVPLLGNPLAVVHDADDLDESAMQALARWTNLSETTFLLRPTNPEADYRVRIFTPGAELPFAGHPTLGSCYAYRKASACTKATVVQECGVGLVRIESREGRLAFEAPAMQRGPIDRAMLDAILRALSLPQDAVVASQRLDNGPVWYGLLLDSAERVLAIEPDHGALASLAKVGVIGPHRDDSECRFEVRAFATPIGVPEDPVTGSLEASFGQWLIDEGIAESSYVASQGTRLGRRGRVHVERRDGLTWVGGHVAECISGTIDLGA